MTPTLKLKNVILPLKLELKEMKNNLRVIYSMSSIYCNNSLPYIFWGKKSHEKINNDFWRAHQLHLIPKHFTSEKMHQMCYHM